MTIQYWVGRGKCSSKYQNIINSTNVTASSFSYSVLPPHLLMKCVDWLDPRTPCTSHQCDTGLLKAILQPRSLQQCPASSKHCPHRRCSALENTRAESAHTPEKHTGKGTKTWEWHINKDLLFSPMHSFAWEVLCCSLHLPFRCRYGSKEVKEQSAYKWWWLWVEIQTLFTEH